MFNFRDIGGGTVEGGRVRKGALLRSDALTDLEEADYRQLAAAGIRTAIDLRETGERNRSAADLRDIDLHHVELIGGAMEELSFDLSDFNKWLLASRGPQLAEVVKLLARPGALPGVYFCSSGKDRTGLVSALLQLLLGVDEETIVRDYALTAELMPEEYVTEAIERAIAGGLPEHMLPSYRENGLGSPPEVMIATLSEINDVYGGAERYLLGVGVTQAELDALRATAIEPDPGPA